jgi:hypothetical protein
MVLGRQAAGQAVGQLIVVLWQSCNEIVHAQKKKSALNERFPWSICGTART